MYSWGAPLCRLYLEDAIELSGYSLTADSDFKRAGAGSMGRRSGKASQSEGKGPKGGAPGKGGGTQGRPGDWTCMSCGTMVFASKNACFSCGTRKGQGKRGKGGGGGKGKGRGDGGEEKEAEPLHLGETTEAWLGRIPPFLL